MATTILSAFEKLKSNLEITRPQEATVSKRQQNVRAAVEAHLQVLDSFLTGSYSRHTMIAPLNEADIDIFIVLSSDYFYHYNGQNGGQAGLLDLLKRRLRQTYPKTPDISRNGQAVTIRFTDFLVDVVPGFHRKGGGYLMPSSITQTWIPTDPKKHVEIISKANFVHGSDFIPLVKMIKAWNKANGQYFGSFHLEVLALQILNGVTISDFPSAIRYFFDRGRYLVAKENPDPAGYGADVGNYINTTEKKKEAVRRFQVAYERSIQAEDYEKAGYTQTAVSSWSKLFTSHFPVYG